MTDVLHPLTREFSRKTFVKGGGALIVAVSAAGALGAKAAQAAEDPYASYGPYDARQIDTWLVVHADNTVSVKAGKVELGQGTSTGLLMIAAEELDMTLSQMRIVTHDTNVTADQGNTVGSQGIQTGGMQIRAVAVAARNALLDLAAANLGVAKASLTVSNGVVSGGGRSVSYGDLLGDKLFNVQMPAAPSLAAGAPGTKPISSYKIVGTHGIKRIDIPDKVTGKFVYVHNVRVPGMLHGRIVRPRGQGGYGNGTSPEILAVDASSIKAIPGARVVRYKNFLGVVAPTEFAAIQAAAQLKVTWAEMPPLTGVGNLFKGMRDFDAAGKTPARFAANTGNFDSAYAAAPIKNAQTYKVHYQGAMAMGPECCVAKVTAQGARIFSNTQGAYTTRPLVRAVLDEVMGAQRLPENRIRITYYEGGGAFGSASPYNDTVPAAAIMSWLAGAPVRLQFMRWDTHGWGNYGPALLADIRGAVDASGKLVAYEYTGYGAPQMDIYPPEQMVTGKWTIGPTGVLETTLNGVQYTVPNRRVIGKTLPLENNYFKTRPLRAPNSVQAAFANEQFVDELAYMAKLDPVAFRLQNVASPATDPSQRWRNALEGVAKLSSWQPRVAASNLSSATVVTGRGVGFGHFSNTRSAAVAAIEVNKKTGKITVKNVWCCMDAGYVVYPDGMHQNEEGAIIQGVSRALHEQVVFDRKGVTSTDWVSYPILRIVDSPKVVVQGLSRTDVPLNDTGATVAASGSRTTGAGEPGTVPVVAAIANAFFDATGLRVREMPMTPGRVRAVIAAAGK
jgi:CO/xanthine dehydrogenase Mo-binding subunit